MFEWQFSKSSGPSPDLPADEGRTWHLTRRRLLLLGILFVLLTSTGLVLRWRLIERTYAMRADLVAFIQDEEQQRLLGHVEQNGDFAVPGAPDEWQAGYRATFQTSGDARPADLTVDSVEFRGTTAVVLLRIGGQQYVRTYRLVDQAWKRTPIPAEAWGGMRTARLPGGILLYYRERDTEFAQRLMRDVPRLLRRLPARTTAKAIIVEPHEFGPALIRYDDGEVVVNSPILVSPDGEASVRVALADALARPKAATAQADDVPRERPSVQPPFTATVLDHSTSADGVPVHVAGWDSPLKLHVDDDATLLGSDGTALPLACTDLYRSLSVEAGRWTNFGHSFSATRLRVANPEPSVTVPAATYPPSSPPSVYLLEAVPPGEGSDVAQIAYSVLAISHDGVSEHLTTFTALHPILALQTSPDAPVRLLLAFTVPGCEQAWFFVYDPERGVSERWLSHPDWRFGNAAQLIWRPEKADRLLFVWPRTSIEAGLPVVDTQRDSILNTDRVLLTNGFGAFDPRAWPASWRTDPNHVLALAHVDPRAQIELLDLFTGSVPRTGTLRHVTVSRGGTHLFYSVEEEHSTSALYVLDLIHGDTQRLARYGGEAQLWPVRGSDPAGRVFVVGGSLQDDRAAGTRLYALDAAHPDRPSALVADLGDEGRITAALVCGDDRVVYTVRRTEQTTVHRRNADGSTTTMATSETPLLPWAC